MRNVIDIFLKYKEYALLVIIAVFANLVFGIAYLLKEQFSAVMSVDSFLVWHNVLEFTSVLISFTVFVVSYYTYEQTGNLRSVFLGSVFLGVGMLDAFHTLSYKGMPAFLIENISSNRATTLWIIARIFTALGFFVASHIPVNVKIRFNRIIFVGIPLFISILILYLTTYHPGLLPPMYIEGMGLTPHKIRLEYLIIILFALSILMFVREYKASKNKMVLLLCISLEIAIFSEAAFVLYFNVYDIYNYLGHIFKFIAFFIIFRAIFINDIQEPYRKLSKAKQKLREHADNLDMIVRERTKELENLNQKLMEDLKYARDIQKSVFTLRNQDWEKVRFEVKNYSSETVSGDFCNVFKIDNDNIGFYIGDVSGHGVPAAMLTIFLNQTIKTLIEMEINELNIISPSEVLENIYRSFNTTNFDEHVYIVMLYAVYNKNTHILTYSSAGLNVLPIFIKSSGEISEIEIKGFPICKFIEFYNGEYQNHMLKLNKNDKILFYTDGLIEAQNTDNSFFGDMRLKKFCRKITINRHRSCQA
ncbi:MASE3 domain-containing protein [Acetivibrio straminisolvens]|uniref:Serine phosphatase n=1 Tax=Acetivibrio straminisolvens JCM 21531 TaxID=1294263 RepID=W4V602_9FIRM|nr:MASE3 domain-containing protein [Acetivibrio straminisolvens]GAE88602.1 serine phosphatase [Acetivibrio straminisolvens JCM 21531]